MKGKKVIVTSGSGFKGSRLIQALVDDNDVTIVGNGSAGKLENLSGHWIDLRKIKALLRTPIIVGGAVF
jgi:nucleoside-diphosphate-sugar epimerase